MATANLAQVAEREEVKAALLAYLDAIALAEPLQAKLWQASRLTLTQLVVLRALRGGPKTVGQLATAAGLSGASMTRLLDRLEERGLVSRQRSETDRRAVVVRLQSSARQLLGEVRVLKGTLLEAAVLGMSPADRRALGFSLRSLVEAVKAQRELQQEGAK